MYTLSWRKIEASECTDESEEDDINIATHKIIMVLTKTINRERKTSLSLLLHSNILKAKFSKAATESCSLKKVFLKSRLNP